MIQQRAQNRQILRYFIACNVQIGGNYKNFHRALVALWGNYKVLGQNIHRCVFQIGRCQWWPPKFTLCTVHCAVGNINEKTNIHQWAANWPNIFQVNSFIIPLIPEHERSLEDDQLLPPDGGRGGLPPLLQRHQEGQQRQVHVRLQRCLLLQERVQAR